jgi:hypothetical protein
MSIGGEAGWARGAFAGLGAVRTEGPSEGGRDELFLALSLELLERRAGELLPFIGDGILPRFDDERTAARTGAARRIRPRPPSDHFHSLLSKGTPIPGHGSQGRSALP